VRLVKLLAAAFAASLAAAPASGEGGSAPVLNPGELLLEIAADGVSHVVADKVTVAVTLNSTGATAAEARAANAALTAHIVAAARSAGVNGADVRIVERRSGALGFMGNEAIESLIQSQSSDPPKVESSTVVIRLRDPKRFAALRDALEAAGADHVPDPLYELDDNVAARRSAKADALRRARDEADVYARNLGMSVGRILRVSERPGPNYEDAEGLQLLVRRTMGASEGPANDIETRITLAVDFALVARR
jgi:uncharacterized protein YggE